jgi:acyl-CoA thioesterase FadM
MLVEMAPGDFNKYGFDLQFRMREKQTLREVALGKIGIVFITRADRKVRLIPEAFMSRLQQASML